MKDYYFTFGQAHITTAGIPMKDKWVRVTAENYGKARSIFVEQFSSIEMEAPDKWAFQYEGDKFNHELFTEGEYSVLTQEEEEVSDEDKG